jgi:hypothetical protein
MGMNIYSLLNFFKKRKIGKRNLKIRNKGNTGKNSFFGILKTKKKEK